jgi:hypothetical protein
VDDYLAITGRTGTSGFPHTWRRSPTGSGSSWPTPITLRYSYFNRPEPLIFDDAGTYVDTDATFNSTRSHEWNHDIGEVVTAVLGEGLRLTEFVEHDSVPWEATPGQMVVDDAGEWRLAEHPQRLAASYTLWAVKG